MKQTNNLFFALLLMTFSAVQAYSQNNYVLVWEDNFDGTHLNESIWNIEVDGNGGGNNELQYYRRENVSVGTDPISGENCLILTAKKENFGGRPATSGRVNTKNKMYFKYGMIEARMRIPLTANGLWPAFWMMGNDFDQVGWPKCGEIDIMEMGNVTGIQQGNSHRRVSGWWHWGTSWAMYGPGAYPNGGNTMVTNYDIQGNYVVFRLYWDETQMRIFIDQDRNPQPYATMGISGSGDASTGTYFKKPFFVLFNLAVGGNYTGITGFQNINNVTALNASNNNEAKMYIDYVRVYQRGDSGESFYPIQCTPLTRTADIEICEGETYDFYGTDYDEAVSGIVHRFPNPSGCDSVVTLNLIINEHIGIALYDTIFENEAYNEQTFEIGNHTFIDILIAGNSCDSIVTTYLHVEVSAGFDLIKAGNISIYPNPVNYELKITNYEGIIEKVEITDLTGKIIINSQFSLEKPKEILNSIDVSTLPQGMYLIKIYTDKGVVVEKFVKQ